MDLLCLECSQGCLDDGIWSCHVGHVGLDGYCVFTFIAKFFDERIRGGPRGWRDIIEGDLCRSPTISKGRTGNYGLELLYIILTLAPSLLKLRTIPAPIPRAPPVTMATLPCSDMVGVQYVLPIRSCIMSSEYQLDITLYICTCP